MTQADITTTELEEFDRGWLEVIQQTRRIVHIGDRQVPMGSGCGR